MSYLGYVLYNLIPLIFPTIGKTIFLKYVLVRRLAIHEMVVYQDTPDAFHIFHERGVARVPISCPHNLVREALSLSTWCLVDSNLEMPDPPPSVVNLGRFLIHAASPGALRRDSFRKKNVSCSLYIMKPMTLQELLLWYASSPSFLSCP